MALTGDRGRVERIRLSRPITFNGQRITRASIEIDHVNRGINEMTGSLRTKERTDFTVREVEKFVLLLDDEEIVPMKRKRTVSRFVVKINCPIRRLHFDRVFVMVFEHDSLASDELYTITLFPGW